MFEPKIMTNQATCAIIKGFSIFKYAYSPGLNKWYWIYSDSNKGSWTGSYSWCLKYLEEAKNKNKWVQIK